MTDQRTSPQVEYKVYTAPPRQIWGWGVGRIAEFSLVGMFGLAMNVFTVGFGLSPVIVSWCMMLPRFIDGIIDPMIGHWSDNTHTRWGRRKPFLLGGAIVGAFLLAGVWWADPAWSATAQFFFLGITGTFLYTCYGMYTMAWTAIGYELSDDYHERSKVQAVQGFFLAVMVLLYGWIYWLALRPFFGGVIWGMRWISAVAAIAVIVSALICFFATKERFTHANRNHVALLPAIKVTMRNRPFVILILMKIGEILGGRLVGQITFFLGVYYTCRGDLDLSTRIAAIGATLGSVWNFAMLPLVKPASKWLGKRGALILGASLGFGCAIVNPFITTPEHPYWSIIPGLVVAPLLVLTGTITSAILPDICDMDEVKTGQRREGLFTSVMAVIAKLEISLAIILSGYIISWLNVDVKINQRWESVSVAKTTAPAAGFEVGEIAVFGFKNNSSTTFDRIQISGDNLKQITLFAGDMSPTEGFRLIGVFDCGNQDNEFDFPPITARYLKIALNSAIDEDRPLTLRHIGLGPRHLLDNARVVATQPPMTIQKHLFWLVMSLYIVFSAFTLLMAILFPLTEEKMKAIREELDERHLAQSLAGAPTDDAAEEYVETHPAEAEEIVKEHGNAENTTDRKS